MDTLRPVEVSEFYIKQVASGMSRYFWDNIFKEIFDILKDNSVDNSKDDIINALSKGSIWYENGAFKSNKRFTNKVAKSLEEMGAIYRRGAYYIDKTEIPFDIIQKMDFVAAQALRKATKLEQFLAGLTTVLDKLTVKDFIQGAVKDMFKKLELDILKSAQEKKVPVIELGISTPNVDISRRQRKEIEKYWKEQDKKADKLREDVEKAKTDEAKQEAREKLTEHQWKTYENAPQVDLKLDDLKLDKLSENVAKDYVYNMNFWIKKWEAKNIIQMRKEVADMVQKGVRIPAIAEYFEKRWKIAKNKAYFLAFNESHLAGSVIKATNYQNLGCTQFKWVRSTALEKRELHKEYYNQIFSFDNPPIIDEKLGIRGLPRQIWNCQCGMAPVSPSLIERIQKREEITNAKRNPIKYLKLKINNSKQRNNYTWRYRQFGEG